MFFSVITKNLNWEVLTKNLFTFNLKEGMGLRGVNIMSDHWKIRFFEEFTKRQYIAGIA